MKLKPLFGVVLALILGVSANAATPQEKNQETLTRTIDSGTTLRSELSMNVFRQEPYQAEYTVQVPYQVQETYYENVPYTETVSYTDYETVYENEYRCENVTRYRQECHNEQVCTPGNRVCQPITECGTNALGQPICKTRNECSDGPRDCRSVPRCQQVPYTDRQCGYESVRKTRPVTRYREETRYRQEARTRTVTKQRTETRCCVTKERSVFDHQFTQPVTVIFPAQAVLLAGESENVTITLRGSETNPDVAVAVQSNVFNYEVAQTRIDGRDKVFILRMLPKWTAANAGTSTVQGLKLNFNKGTPKVTFKETVASPRMVSMYQVEVRDLQSQALLAEQTLQGQEAKVFEAETLGLARDGKYSITLKVQRQGINVVGGTLEFIQTLTYEKKELDQTEIQDLRNKALVSLGVIEGTGADRVVTINDQTDAVEEVKSTYKLVVWKKLSNGKIDWLGEKSFAREDIQRAGGELAISFKAVGVNPAESQKLYMDLVVQRTSAQYLGSQKVQFIVNKNF